jgi:hypothetical protein
MATKGNSKGRYMTKVGFYDIYAKYTYRPKKDGASKYDSPEVASTDFVIYHSKKMVQKGLKTKDIAITKAKELLGSKYREIYSIN